MYVVIDEFSTSLELFIFKPGLSLLSQSLLVCQVLQSLSHLNGPVLDLLQYIHAFSVVRSSTLVTEDSGQERLHLSKSILFLTCLEIISRIICSLSFFRIEVS